MRVFSKLNFITPKGQYKTGKGNIRTLENWVHNGNMLNYLLRVSASVVMPNDFLYGKQEVFAMDVNEKIKMVQFVLFRVK
ncbi:hypothetical protein OF376_01670 [Ureaplasma miroungigenitalium]|uniref:Uncharacterized protein n=1 Tax=Ureaplasma miroungigenitalium TaxID=1042321 RepID=A0ABT3BMM4_9BACT|nr:hypothetical protein [Ureaplasma miroungigenitalium]MCV3728473.1 hypothetical protein [Ureaplasma miroungigenitalium]MCV3734260.1 hypothetical protein [Ureaplasma miroungigenitalium]